MLRFSKAEGLDKFVLVCIANYTDEKHQAFPSVPTLAKDAGVCERTVQNIIARLIELGELKKVERPGPNGNGSNIYLVHILHQGVQQMHQGGAADAPGVVQQMHPILSSLTNHLTNTGKLTLAGVLSGAEPDLLLRNHSGFMEAWKRFAQYKLKRCGSKVTIRAFQLELKTLARYPNPKAAIEAMEHAERCGWQGLQEYKKGVAIFEPEKVRFNSIGQRIY